MKQSISELLKIAKTTRRNKSYARLPAGPFRYRSSQASLSVQSSNLVKYVKDAISSAVSSGADRVAGSLVFRSSSTGIETSAGASGNDSLSSLEDLRSSFLWHGGLRSIQLMCKIKRRIFILNKLARQRLR